MNLKSVKRLYIGIGQRCATPTDPNGGEGQISIDDIRLYQQICLPEDGPLADFTNDCFVNIDDVNVMSEEWLTTGVLADIYPQTPDGIVDFRDFAVLADEWFTVLFWPDP